MDTPPQRLWLGVATLIAVVIWSFLAGKRVGESTQPNRSEPAQFAPAKQGHRVPSAESKPKMKCQDLFQMACLKRGVTADPSGEVHPNVRGELEALRLYEEIIHEHPEWNSEQVDEKLVNLIYTDKRRKRMMNTFAWVATEMKKFIDAQPDSVFSAEMKRTLKKRLHRTSLELPPPAALYASEPDLFTKNEIYFEGRENGQLVIRVGGAYLLTVKSWFNRVFTLSHELAHAIDPCELRASKVEPASYRRLARCFYRHKITKRDPDTLNCDYKNQLGEAFADWVASHITAKAMESYKEKLKRPEDVQLAAINAVRDLCDQETWIVEADKEVYPDPALRIGKIFAAHPEVRVFLNCEVNPDDPPYCSF